MNFLIGGVAIFPKCVYFAQLMQQRGVTHIHAHFANHPAAAALIARGADIHAKANDGETPLHKAAWFSAAGVAVVLIEHDP